MKHGAKILIVGDEPAVIQMLRKTFQGMGKMRYASKQAGRNWVSVHRVSG